LFVKGSLNVSRAMRARKAASSDSGFRKKAARREIAKRKR